MDKAKQEATYNRAKEICERAKADGCKLFSGEGRDPERIPPFLEEIGNEWRKLPDTRFGQLMNNFFSVHSDSYYWNWEEDDFLREFKKHIHSRT